MLVWFGVLLCYVWDVVVVCCSVVCCFLCCCLVCCCVFVDGVYCCVGLLRCGLVSVVCCFVVVAFCVCCVLMSVLCWFALMWFVLN